MKQDDFVSQHMAGAYVSVQNIVRMDVLCTSQNSFCD